MTLTPEQEATLRRMWRYIAADKHTDIAFVRLCMENVKWLPDVPKITLAALREDEKQQIADDEEERFGTRTKTDIFYNYAHTADGSSATVREPQFARLDRYILVDTIPAPRVTGTDKCISYLDLFAPQGTQLRCVLEPIGEEL